MRHADELSTTTAPVAATTGASFREVDAPAEKKAMSRPEQSAVDASSTRISVYFHRKYLPAERAEANRRRDATGNWRSARMESIMSPTSPLAPTIPTCTP